MKICLIAGSAPEVAPYLELYAKLCREAGITYDRIVKRPRGDATPPAENDKVFCFDPVRTPFGRWRRFAAYADFCKRVLQTGTYGRAVVFTAMNGTFLARCGALDGIPYLADVRDVDKSMTSPLLARPARHFLGSAKRVIVSSPAFADLLPGSPAVQVSHNLPQDAAETAHTRAFTGDTITVGYFGKIGYFNANRALALAVRDDPRIRLLYRGIYPKTDNIRDFCRETGIENAVFEGAFDNGEKPALYREVDLINAVYGNDSPVVTTALPNKLYDAACYKIPIMVCAGTYLAEVVKANGLGFAVDPARDDLCAAIHAFAAHFDPAAFEKNCSAFLTAVRAEQAVTLQTIKDFLGVERHVGP